MAAPAQPRNRRLCEFTPDEFEQLLKLTRWYTHLSTVNGEMVVMLQEADGEELPPKQRELATAVQCLGRELKRNLERIAMLESQTQITAVSNEDLLAAGVRARNAMVASERLRAKLEAANAKLEQLQTVIASKDSDIARLNAAMEARARARADQASRRAAIATQANSQVAAAQAALEIRSSELAAATAALERAAATAAAATERAVASEGVVAEAQTAALAHELESHKLRYEVDELRQTLHREQTAAAADSAAATKRYDDMHAHWQAINEALQRRLDRSRAEVDELRAAGAVAATAAMQQQPCGEGHVERIAVLESDLSDAERELARLRSASSTFPAAASANTDAGARVLLLERALLESDSQLAALRAELQMSAERESPIRSASRSPSHAQSLRSPILLNRGEPSVNDDGGWHSNESAVAEAEAVGSNVAVRMMELEALHGEKDALIGSMQTALELLSSQAAAERGMAAAHAAQSDAALADALGRLGELEAAAAGLASAVGVEADSPADVIAAVQASAQAMSRKVAAGAAERKRMLAGQQMTAAAAAGAMEEKDKEIQMLNGQCASLRYAYEKGVAEWKAQRRELKATIARLTKAAAAGDESERRMNAELFDLRARLRAATAKAASRKAAAEEGSSQNSGYDARAALAELQPGAEGRLSDLVLGFARSLYATAGAAAERRQ